MSKESLLNADTAIDLGPAVGTPFPDVVLPDQTGTPIDLHQARQGRQALVVFYRSAAW